ncbi:hypothetical protein NFI96_023038, partial [Prochilodus magdalenae]
MLWAVMENRNVPLTWTNQISAQTPASKTLTISSPPAPVSEMERSRAVLIAFMCVLISSISGVIVEVRVKPGDNATIYCDCALKTRHTVVWLRKSSHKLEPSLIRFTENSGHPRYSRVWNSSSLTYDLLVEKVTESDLGLYYCALIGKNVDTSGGRLPDVFHEGNRTTFLSFLGESISSGVDPHQTFSVSDCSVCWKLLVSVCTVGVLLTSTYVYHIYRSRTKADGTAERRENMELRNHNEVGDGGDCGGGGGDVEYAPLDILSSGQRRLKKRTVESSDLCTYS